jgi:hypothetical protein
MIRPVSVLPPDQGVHGLDMSGDWRGRPLVIIDDDGVFQGLTGSHRLQGAIDSRLPSVPALVAPWAEVRQLVADQFGFELELHELPLDDHGLGLVSDALELAGYLEAAQVLRDESALAPRRHHVVVYGREGTEHAWLKVDGVPHQCHLRGDVWGRVQQGSGQLSEVKGQRRL